MEGSGVTKCWKPKCRDNTVCLLLSKRLEPFSQRFQTDYGPPLAHDYTLEMTGNNALPSRTAKVANYQLLRVEYIIWPSIFTRQSIGYAQSQVVRRTLQQASRKSLMAFQFKDEQPFVHRHPDTHCIRKRRRRTSWIKQNYSVPQ